MIDDQVYNANTCDEWGKPCKRQLYESAKSLEQHVQGVCEVRSNTYRLRVRFVA